MTGWGVAACVAGGVILAAGAAYVGVVVYLSGAMRQ